MFVYDNSPCDCKPGTVRKMHCPCMYAVLIHAFNSLLCSNGSVKVIFRVIVKVLKPSKESNDVVAVKIGRKINKQLKTGRIGNILVVPDAIKLKGNFNDNGRRRGWKRVLILRGYLYPGFLNE